MPGGQDARCGFGVFPELWNIGSTPCPLDAVARQAWEAFAINQKSHFFREFVGLARELNLNSALTYLEKHAPKPRNTVSIINGRGEIVLNYAKRFICNFGLEELLRPNPNLDDIDIGCDFNCDPGDSFGVCTLVGKAGEANVGAMICADREFPEAATALMIKGAEIIAVPNSCTWDKITARGKGIRKPTCDRNGELSCSDSQWTFASVHRGSLEAWRFSGDIACGSRRGRRDRACRDRHKRYS